MLGGAADVRRGVKEVSLGGHVNRDWEDVRERVMGDIQSRHLPGRGNPKYKGP